MERHWSFFVTDPYYLIPLSFIILGVGLWRSISNKDASYFPRFGNFIVALGVWMSMRYVFREGINTYKNALDASPTLPGNPGDKAFMLNTAYFNNISFSIGDAWLSVYGFALVVLGSTIGSFGDLILKYYFPRTFTQNKDKGVGRSRKAKRAR